MDLVQYVYTKVENNKLFYSESLKKTSSEMKLWL